VINGGGLGCGREKGQGRWANHGGAANQQPWSRTATMEKILEKGPVRSADKEFVKRGRKTQRREKGLNGEMIKGKAEASSSDFCEPVGRDRPGSHKQGI